MSQERERISRGVINWGPLMYVGLTNCCEGQRGEERVIVSGIWCEWRVFSKVGKDWVRNHWEGLSTVAQNCHCYIVQLFSSSPWLLSH